MSDIAVEFDHVWKKFKKGEMHNSLRDLIPAVTKRLFSTNHRADLGKREFWALKDVSFQVRRGEALGIIGPNGAGKSTMLKLLSGILRPNRGNIKINGRLSALIEVGAGFHPDLTGRENVYLNGTILGMKKSEIDKKFDTIVQFSGLDDFIDTPVKRYSSGMYARLGFAVAAHVDPDILLVDEVLSVGDMKFQEKCLQKMRSFADNATTVVFVSHNLAAVHTLCSTTAFLWNGQLRRIGPTEEAISDYLHSVQADDESSASEVAIRNICLVAENNQMVDKLSPGQRTYLRFKLRLACPINECHLGFIIHRVSDGLPVCDYNLPLDSVKAAPDHTGDVKCLVGFDVNLLRGAYSVELHLYHFPTARHLIRVRNAAFFSIEERISWDGVAHLSPVLITDGGIERFF